MTQPAASREPEHVGPVLEAGQLSQAVIAALRSDNDGVVVRDRGSYLRVLVPVRCVLRRSSVERIIGRPFQLPQDLELIMPSFKGVLSMSDEEASWSFQHEPA